MTDASNEGPDQLAAAYAELTKAVQSTAEAVAREAGQNRLQVAGAAAQSLSAILEARAALGRQLAVALGRNPEY